MNLDTTSATLKLSAAMANKNALLHAAAVGKPVKAQDLRAAEEAVRAAELDATLADQVAKHATAERCRATIAEFQERADALASLAGDLVDEHIKAARELDEAMMIARAAADKLDGVRQALADADRAAHTHNGLLDAEARTNAVLAAQHRSVWPKAKTAGPLPSPFGYTLRPDLVRFNPAPSPFVGTGGRDEVVRQTAEQIARGAHPLTIVATKAA